jgi:hypothetical protein
MKTAKMLDKTIIDKLYYNPDTGYLYWKKFDNRWSNLRQCTRSENQRNKGKHLRRNLNRVLPKGVSRKSSGNSWQVTGRGSIYLGSYKCLGEACRISNSHWSGVLV